MAMVLPAEESSHFASHSGGGALRRSHSQPKFSTSPSFRRSSSTTCLADLATANVAVSVPDSSSAPSLRSNHISIRIHRDPDSSESDFSDPSDDVDHFILPSYSQAFSPPLESEPIHKVSSATVSYTSQPQPSPPPDPQTHLHSPFITAEDDLAAVSLPSRHVDYLSHDWTEEDVWSSWKFIVSRRGEYTNSARLENASWRSWMQSKNKLKTVPAENLNWLKECDITWLYGPLQPASQAGSKSISGSSTARPLDKKPILKKRTISELMLAESISSASLLKQATAEIHAQQSGLSATLVGKRLQYSAAATPIADVTAPLSSRDTTNTSLLSSVVSSGLVSPSSEKKRIHFNEEVEQCIAVEIKDGDDNDNDNDCGYLSEVDVYNSSDEDAVMMKPTTIKRRPTLMSEPKSAVVSVEGKKTIEKLPCTKLKDDDHEDGAISHSTGILRSPILSPSSSLETITGQVAHYVRTSSSYFHLGHFDYGEDDPNPSLDWDFPNTSATEYSVAQFEPNGAGLQRTTSSSTLSTMSAGLHRTESGMFMPLDNGGTADPNDTSLMGRVMDTVNTARDIVHVIWNVGWRK